jgi:hypothetical protein
MEGRPHLTEKESFQFLRRDSEIGIAHFIESKAVEFKVGGVDVELPALVVVPRKS